MKKLENAVASHYGRAGLLEAILAGLKTLGLIWTISSPLIWHQLTSSTQPAG